MKIDVEKRPRIVVDRIATIEGIEFDLDDLGKLLEALDSEQIRIRDGFVATKLKQLNIVKSPGRRDLPAEPGPRFREALDAVRLATDEADSEY